MSLAVSQPVSPQKKYAEPTVATTGGLFFVWVVQICSDGEGQGQPNRETNDGVNIDSNAR